MNRVGARLDPATFIEAVAVAFKDAQADDKPESMAQKFRTEPSFQLFQNALGLAQREAGAQSICVLGCGRGFAGEPADFALSVVREVFDSHKIKETFSLNLSPSLLRFDRKPLFVADPQTTAKEGEVDLVVVHSLLHYVPEISKVFDLVRWLLKPRGGLIVSHEPNARFWHNPACQSAVAELQRSRRRRRLRRYLNRSRSLLQLRGRKTQPPTLWDRVNMLLKERYQLAGPLTENEIRRLVDIHRPESVPRSFCIGLNGFDFDELSRIHLPGFHLEWIGTTGHLGYETSLSATSKWQRKAMALAEQEPLAGCVFTGYWKRHAA
jgi:SAM-dependent methyltransferase